MPTNYPGKPSSPRSASPKPKQPPAHPLTTHTTSRPATRVSGSPQPNTNSASTPRAASSSQKKTTTDINGLIFRPTQNNLKNIEGSTRRNDFLNAAVFSGNIDDYRSLANPHTGSGIATDYSDKNNTALITAFTSEQTRMADDLLTKREVVDFIANSDLSKNNPLVEVIAQTRGLWALTLLIGNPMICKNKNLFLAIYQAAARRNNNEICNELVNRFENVRKYSESEQEKIRQQIINLVNNKNEPEFRNLIDNTPNITAIITEEFIREITQIDTGFAPYLIMTKYIFPTNVQSKEDYKLSGEIYDYLLIDEQYKATDDNKLDFFTIARQEKPEAISNFCHIIINRQLANIRLQIEKNDFTFLSKLGEPDEPITAIMSIHKIFKFVLAAAVKAKNLNIVTAILDTYKYFKDVYRNLIDGSILNSEVLTLPADEVMRDIIAKLLVVKHKADDQLGQINQYLALDPKCAHKDKEGKSLFDSRDSQELKRFCEMADRAFFIRGLSAGIREKKSNDVQTIINKYPQYHSCINDDILNRAMFTLPADEPMRDIIVMLLVARHTANNQRSEINQYLALDPNCTYQDIDGKTLFNSRDSQELKRFCESANKILTAKMQALKLHEYWVCKKLNLPQPKNGDHIKLQELLQRYINENKYGLVHRHHLKIISEILAELENQKKIPTKIQEKDDETYLFEKMQKELAKIEIDPQGTLALIMRYMESKHPELTTTEKLHYGIYAQVAEKYGIKEEVLNALDPGPRAQKILTEFCAKPLFSLLRHDDNITLVKNVLRENLNASAQNYYIALVSEMYKNLTTINPQGPLVILLYAIEQLAISETMQIQALRQGASTAQSLAVASADVAESTLVNMGTPHGLSH